MWTSGALASVSHEFSPAALTSGLRSRFVSVVLLKPAALCRDTLHKHTGALPYMHFSSNRKSSEGLDFFFPSSSDALMYSKVLQHVI